MIPVSVACARNLCVKYALARGDARGNASFRVLRGLRARRAALSRAVVERRVLVASRILGVALLRVNQGVLVAHAVRNGFFVRPSAHITRNSPSRGGKQWLTPAQKARPMWRSSGAATLGQLRAAPGLAYRRVQNTRRKGRVGKKNNAPVV